MIGAVIGDIAGSRFEFHNYRAKDFTIFHEKCSFTDDSVMTAAIAKAILESREYGTDLSEEAVRWMQQIGRPYPFCGYGGRFYSWMYSNDPKPYRSFGNGAAMRVSPCGWAASSLEEALSMSDAVTRVTHNHPEGMKGARAAAAAVYLARTGSTKEEIRQYIEESCGYRFDFTIDSIRDTYAFNETCQETVPQALEAFFEAQDFEDAVRTAVSVGGDSDTLAAITCGAAEAMFGVPETMRETALSLLDPHLRGIVLAFEAQFGRG